MEINRNNETTRIFGLDIFRAVAILLVVFGHGLFLLDNTRFNGFPYFRMIDGVDLFFVLSGFLIGGILLKEINSEKKFGIDALRKFWKRRWLRTLPNYYLILLINYLVVKYEIIHEDINQFNWKFLFFLQNLSKPFYGFFWESWSLTIEEWFYISTPLLLILFLNFICAQKAFILTTTLMIVLPFLYRICILDPSIDDFWYDVTFRKIVLTRLDGIAYGLLASWVFYYYYAYWNKLKIISAIVGVLLILVIINTSAPNSSFYKQVIYFSISPFSAMLLLPFAESIKTSKGIISKAITHISKISYSMYLLNLAIVAEVIGGNFPSANEKNGIINYIIYWILVLGMSTLLYNYFEKPIMRLRDR